MGYQGIRGAYSHLACLEFFRDEDIEAIGCKTFKEVFYKVERGELDFGVIPIENSIAGSVIQNFDLLLKYDVKIVGEIFLRIKHCLISHRGNELKNIRRVLSHPQALAQCSEFLEKHNLEPVPTYDTTSAVEIVKKNGNIEEAAIASRLAAKIYDMEIIVKDIQKNPYNVTRFFVITRKNNSLIIRKEKTAIVFTCDNVPGSLFRCLKGFADNKINITKIESRAIPEKPWEYFFFLDFEGGINEERVKNALNSLKETANMVKILGSYPKGKLYSS